MRARLLGNRAALALATALWVGALAPGADAQTLEDIRDAIRAVLVDARYPVFVASLVDLAEENELSAANYTLNDGVGTKLSTLKLPVRKVIDVGSEDYGVYAEANFGYLTAESQFETGFMLEEAELDARIDADWTVYSGLVGAGLALFVAEGLTVTPLVDVSLAYVDSDADYDGSGAELSAALFDGLFFNWNAWILTYGPGLRVDWQTPLSETVELETIGRYDLRFSNTLSSTDEAQDDEVTSQRFTLRGDVTGPTPLKIGGEELGWRGTLGYTWFPGETADALGFNSFVSVGGGLELPLGDSIPVVSELTVSGALIFGNGVKGWTVGVGASF